VPVFRRGNEAVRGGTGSIIVSLELQQWRIIAVMGSMRIVMVRSMKGHCHSPSLVAWVLAPVRERSAVKGGLGEGLPARASG